MKSNAGMSLIEITIAVAILAVMLTSFLALMPQGLTAARDQALATNLLKAKVFHLNCSPLCRMCRKADESVA
ncbi:MAG: prepilin-type N-terminal cleavage/methylation domain-containing protein, partial [Verrucomicrobiota bacterium]